LSVGESVLNRGSLSHLFAPASEAEPRNIQPQLASLEVAPEAAAELDELEAIDTTVEERCNTECSSRPLFAIFSRDMTMLVGNYSMGKTRSTLCHKFSPACSTTVAPRNVTWSLIPQTNECETDLPHFLDFVTRITSSTACDVKWIVSSRNKRDLEQRLCSNGSKAILSLELNAQHVARASSGYIEHNVSEFMTSRSAT
jgi:hypothetical protein